MSAQRYLPEIIERFPRENPNDVVMMIEILARERARAAESRLSDEVYDFAATILCTIFDPIKLELKVYPRRMQVLRRSYRGIAIKPQLQVRFKNSMTSTLLSAPDAREAIRTGIDALFRQKTRRRLSL